MPANYVLLEEVTLSIDTASVILDNIPQTGYTDLIVICSTRSSASASAWSDIIIKPNNSTTGISTRVLYGTGSTAASTTFTTGIPAVGEGNAGTTNTFGNTEVYIPNYASSNFKSFSANSVSENNAISSLNQIGTMLWSNTSAITSLVFTDFAGGNFVTGSTFSLYGVAALGTTPVIIPKASGGDIVTNDGTYWYHAFLTSGVFTPALALSCDALVVAGGGGGGWNLGAGGGAGGLVYTTQLIPATSQAITIGAGGTAGFLSYAEATAGGNSTVGSLITANGGGRGGSSSSTESIRLGGAGGSAGGSDGYAPATGTTTLTAGVNPSPAGQGNAGGGAYGNNLAPYGNGNAGGGGGAGAPGGTGSNGSPWQGGNGGNGLAYNAFGAATSTGQLSSGSYYYAGGGGGASLSTGTQPTGGLGGGGLGGRDGNEFPTAGTANTGGGGGGSRGNNGNGTNGGSGIVIIRYTVA
jgi:hypothetical protein